MSKPKFTCIDLFAGCGGLSLGLKLAGFKTLLFSELNKDASATFAANHDRDVICEGDVHNLTKSDGKVLKAHLKKWASEGIGPIVLVCGGPPGQG